MSDRTHTRRPASTRVHFVVALVCIVLFVVSCGDSAPPAPYFPGGGSSGTGGTGNAGTGGTAGGDGLGGVGGEVGTGGTAGAGGSMATGGSAGSAGTGGSAEGCVTNALCQACPDATCTEDSECSFLPGLVCVPTGCTLDGEPQKECQPARYVSCVGDGSEDGPGDCPDDNYVCKPVGNASRCVRKEGCTPSTEDYDCPPGFSCESGSCVDRRVPCNPLQLNCPKNHVCFTVQNASTSPFCVSAFRSCNATTNAADPSTDCSFLGSQCADVDGDGRSECIGALSGSACVNSRCDGPSAPVCEAIAVTVASCGDHGLCQSNEDCDEAAGFECIALWQDGRRECVQSPPQGDEWCDQVTDCPPQQVCAAPRSGDNPPSCQSGTAP